MQALEQRVNEANVTRIRLELKRPLGPNAKGWVSLTSSSGKVLLEEVANQVPKTKASNSGQSKNGNSGSGGTSVAVGTRLKATCAVLVRTGVEMNSAKTGTLQPGENVTVLDSAEIKDGITRVRFKGRVVGWASIRAKSGEVLLAPDSSSDSTVSRRPPSKTSQQDLAKALGSEAAASVAAWWRRLG